MERNYGHAGTRPQAQVSGHPEGLHSDFDFSDCGGALCVGQTVHER